MYRVIALDLDGTILNSDKKVSEISKKVLQHLTSKTFKNANGQDVMVLLASGRAPYLVQPVEEEIEIDCNLIGYNGGLCLSTKSEGRSTLFSRSIEYPHMQQIFKYVDENNHFLNVYGESHVYGTSKAELRAKPDIYAKMTGATYKFFDHPYSELSESVAPTKSLIIFEDEQECDSMLEQLKPQFPEVSLVKSNCMTKEHKQFYVEFLQKGVNKGSAIRDFCKAKNISIDQVIAFGDAENDIEMLTEAGHGICLANGADQTKQAANYVSEFTNDQDGVARELIKVFNLPAELFQ
ncbi:hypothetical protein CYY_003099 [Polysphondylium violaceum]|uniref:Uncharacterized protein n=1 Tax=Polysphondylium violaceum TaxID=133409 RepID=A0A8J4Q0I2_9MYCE|nr:hypothetical protein CYY_003099 [Polysphondylium violaceum]